MDKGDLEAEEARPGLGVDQIRTGGGQPVELRAHIVAYEVGDVQAELDRLSAEGAELIDAEPREGLFGLQVAFVHPDAVHGVLTEVVSVD